jgi:hypothetical protein
MGKVRCLIALFFILVLTGCATRADKKVAFESGLQQFVGQSIDKLMLAKGIPTGTAELSFGKKLVEYSKSHVETSGGNSYTSYQSVYTPNSSGGTWRQVPVQKSVPISSQLVACKLLFVVSAGGIVESWKHDGGACY